MTAEGKFTHIRRILNEEWDPIGLRAGPDDDEYDSYAGFIRSRLWQRDELCTYLLKTETETIGMTYSQERKTVIESVADKILAILGNDDATFFLN